VTSITIAVASSSDPATNARKPGVMLSVIPSLPLRPYRIRA
jgi:hypothetical protein